MATFFVAHGAWSAGWAWEKMHPLLAAHGHRLLVPTYTGLGERAHLARPDIGLVTHVEDLLSVLHDEDLCGAILVGHSYGGMVATALADRAPQRFSHLVYLDAFVPRDGQSLFDLQPPQVRARMSETARAEGEGWRIPPNPLPPDTAPDDVAWILPRRAPQPLRTFEEPARITGAIDRLPKTYIYCTRSGPGDVFRPFALHARSAPGWRLLEIDASHSPHVTAPEALTALLADIAAARR